VLVGALSASGDLLSLFVAGVFNDVRLGKGGKGEEEEEGEEREELSHRRQCTAWQHIAYESALHRTGALLLPLPILQI
jgi:hypothetical protein